MSLTELSIKAAKAQEKSYKLYDAKGLFLLVTLAGARLWRFKYEHDGVEKLISLGIYPDVKLKDARDKRDEARRLVAANVDPISKRRAEKSARADTFGAVPDEWLEGKKATLTAGTWRRDRDQLVKLVGPYLGNRVTCFLRLGAAATFKRKHPERSTSPNRIHQRRNDRARISHHGDPPS